MRMIIAVACDHGGYRIKEAVLEAVREAGHEAVDLGVYTIERVDYPDYAKKVGDYILEKKAQRGIVMCSSGVGVCVAANKIKGIYAGLCHDTYSAHQGVEHDNMNVLCLGGNIVGPELAKELVSSFLKAHFFGTGNYLRRFEKIQKLEAGGD
jgi:RpiB/LacA/LacB family sugar-phosphate isomerase